MTIKEIISDALFDCYRGYNTETIADLKMRERYQNDAKADRVLAAIKAAGYSLTREK